VVELGVSGGVVPVPVATRVEDVAWVPCEVPVDRALCDVAEPSADVPAEADADDAAAALGDEGGGGIVGFEIYTRQRGRKRQREEKRRTIRKKKEAR